MIEKVINIIKNEGITKIPKDLVATINHMSYAVNGSYLINVLEYFGIKKEGRLKGHPSMQYFYASIALFLLACLSRSR